MLSFILGAALTTPPGSPDLSGRCASALAALARAGSIEATSRADTVTLAGTALRLTAHIEGEQRAGSKWLVGIAVQALPTGNASALIAGSVGVGADRADALDTAVQEWAQLAGVALIRAIAVKERSKEVIAVPGMVVYPGSTGIRGSQELAWSKPNHEQLLKLLSPILNGLTRGQLHSLSLTITVDSSGSARGECQLDGSPSPAVLGAALRYPWPKPAGTYMFKQYYVLRTAT